MIPDERSARWILHPGSERQISGVRRQRLAAHRAGWALIAASLYLCPIYCFLPLSGLVAGPVSILLFVVVLLLHVRALRWWLARRNVGEAQLESIVSDLSTDRPFLDGWPVEMTVYQGAAKTGADVGLVWFEDGRLYFSGHRTSFGLSPGDVRGEFQERAPIPDLRSRFTLDLQNRASVGFDVLVQDDPFSAAQDRLGRDVRGWLRQADREPGQSPPRTVGPDAPSPRLLLVRAVLPSLYWGAIFAGPPLFFLGQLPLGLIFVPLLSLAPFLPEVWHPLRRWRAWNDRRQYDRGSR